MVRVCGRPKTHRSRRGGKTVRRKGGDTREEALRNALRIEAELVQQWVTQEYFHRIYAWVTPAVKRRDQVLADPDLAFKKWLERSLDELFNGAA